MELIIEDAVLVTMAVGNGGTTGPGGTAAGTAGDNGAMLVRDGRIAAIGSAGAVRAAAAPGARVIDQAGQQLAALGLTAACDADLRRDTFAAFAEADDSGVLHQRIYGLVVHDQVDWLLTSGLRGRRSGRLATAAVKIWADGGMSSRTAAIHGRYPVPPYGSGILYFERDELTRMVRDFDARGFQVCIHAQGDRAIETVLAYAATLAGVRGNPRRHRIEHAGALYPPLAARAAALGILVVSQPGFLSALGDGFAAAFPGRHEDLYSFRSWQEAGVRVAGSSDAPVITADPLTGIRDAVLRRTAGGQVLGVRERLSRWERSPSTPGTPRSPCTARPRSARLSRASSLTSPCWTPARSARTRSTSPA